MEYRILGPLEVSRDGVPVPIKGRHQPRLLAALLLEAGRTVTVSRLVEVLWDAEPPETARRQVQNYVAALRRAFGADDPVEVVGEGYRLEVAGSTVDSLRFGELVEKAREDASAGRHAEALAGLNEALGLWRGTALAGLPGRVLEAGAARLDDVRLGAVEERAGACLELGQHERVVAELRDVLGDNPYRQRAAGQLMVALYRCGRSAEALECFETLRTRLAEELGIDPGPALREVHLSVLNESLDLKPLSARTSTNPAKPEGPIPAQLPADVATFTGRAEQMVELDKLLDTGSGVAVLSAISGGGGVGKTALAVHWGRARRERFPDGQLYINLRGFDHGEPVEPADALARFLRALGVSSVTIPASVDEASVLYRSKLEGRRALVILDNARTAEQVRPLLPGGGESTVIVTSRNRLASLAAIDDAKLIGLDTLSPSESLELLAELIGAERLYADTASARRLAEICGFLPLALRIVGANLQATPHTSLAAFAESLEANRLDRLMVEGDARADIAATFNLSFGSLDFEDQQLLLRLGLIPGVDFTASLANMLSGLDESDARRRLGRLESAHLVEQHGPDRYRFHDLVRAYVRRRADSDLDESTHDGVRERCTDWYCAINTAESGAELANVISAFDAWRTYEGGWRLAVALGSYVAYGYSMAELRRLVEPELERVAGLDDKSSLSQMYNSVAKLCREAGDHISAIEFGSKAVSVISATPHGDYDGKYRGNFALYLSEAGQCIEAEKHARAALVAARSAANQMHIEVCATILAAACRELGAFDESETLLQSLLDGHGGTFDSPVGLSTRHQFLMLYRDMGRVDDVRDLLGEFTSAFDETKPTRPAMVLLLFRGDWNRRFGRFTQAHGDLMESLAIASQTYRTGGIRDAEIALAELFLDLAEPDVALAHIANARDSRQGPVTRQHLADCLRVECGIRIHQGQYSRAVETGQEACALSVAMSSLLQHARALAALANAHNGLGDPEKALASRREALDIFTRLGVPDAERLRTQLDARPR